MITVVGIGADGWDGLGGAARSAIAGATVLVGNQRQLDLVPLSWVPEGRREVLPSPLLPALDALAARDGLCVLASGDPMFHGIGATLARVVGTERLHVIPAVSSISLAAARLGWALQSATVCSLLTAGAESVLPLLAPGARLLVLARDGGSAAELAAVLQGSGWGASRITVLAELGGPGETVTEYDVAGGARTPDLCVLALEAVASPDALWGPGVPDGVFDTDGALTRREVRVLVLAALRPAAGQLLWDVGAGSGSIGIEWLRAAPGSRAIAVEPRADRGERIVHNALTLGVPSLRLVTGTAPDALAGLEQPQAVFVGGGVTVPGVLEACHDALAPGGRLVATAVTVETEAVLHRWAARAGGRLTRLALSHASPLGGFTAWRPELPIVIWETIKA